MVKAVMDRIFIRLPKKEQTKNGLILTSFSDNRTRGIVESVGPEVSCVKVGDDVLFHDFDELPTYDEDVVVVRQNSILGVFENE